MTRESYYNHWYPLNPIYLKPQEPKIFTYRIYPSVPILCTLVVTVHVTSSTVSRSTMHFLFCVLVSPTSRDATLSFRPDQPFPKLLFHLQYDPELPSDSKDLRFRHDPLPDFTCTHVSRSIKPCLMDIFTTRSV